MHELGIQVSDTQQQQQEQERSASLELEVQQGRENLLQMQQQ